MFSLRQAPPNTQSQRLTIWRRVSRDSNASNASSPDVEGSAMPNTPKHERNQSQTLAETLRHWGFTQGHSHWWTTWQHESTWPWDPEPPTVLMIHILQALIVPKRKHGSSTAAAAADFECANSHNHDWPGRRSVAIFLHLGIKFIQIWHPDMSWVQLSPVAVYQLVQRRNSLSCGLTELSPLPPLPSKYTNLPRKVKSPEKSDSKSLPI